MRFSLRLWLILLLAAWIMPPTLHAETPEPTLAPPKTFDLKEIDDYLARQTKAKGFVGLSVAIMKDGKIVLAKGYGKSSLKTDTDVKPQTLFGAGSVTKQFTCACILLLAEDGKLSVRDQVAKYYPDLTKAKEITLYDLMTHVSGYPDYYPLDFVDRRMEKPIALDELIRQYAGGKLDFEPGARWSYSNTGYMILGRVVEKVSGQSFATFLEERILKPLALADAAFEPKLDRKGVATGYTSFFLGEPEIAPPEREGWIHAAGGLFASPSDLVRWDLALMEGKILKPESYKLMTGARKLADGRVQNYGCGLGILQRDGETILRHGGAVSGFLTFNTLVPRTKSAVAIMTNSDCVNLAFLNTEILTLLLKSQVAETLIPKVRGPAPKEAALEMLHELQAGEIKRDNLGEDFNLYLTPARVAKAKDRLQALGEPEKVEVEETHERGGMEVAVIAFTFKKGKVKAYLYRTPDGKVQEFLLYKS